MGYPRIAAVVADYLMNNVIVPVKSRVFCLVGDGETNEGLVWEAIETSAKYKLENFIRLVQ
jgi:transketolase N-terminal domain/subunit